MDERLQKILSQWGVASRRSAEQMILEGRVSLNGKVAQLGQKADPLRDEIQVDGIPVHSQNRPDLTYLLLHKPLGVVSTCSDPQGRPTVLDCLPPDLQKIGIHPVGRLDAFSTGAILLTNDGDLTFVLTHPRHFITKTYEVLLQGLPTDLVLQQWRRGVVLDGKKTLPATVEILQYQRENHCTLVKIVIREGRNRQIRRVAEQCGHPVVKLHRVSIGPINLGHLPRGQYRHLTEREIDLLHSQAKQARSPSV